MTRRQGAGSGLCQHFVTFSTIEDAVEYAVGRFHAHNPAGTGSRIAQSVTEQAAGGSTKLEIFPQGEGLPHTRAIVNHRQLIEEAGRPLGGP